MASPFTPLYFVTLLAILYGLLAVYCKQGEVKFTKRSGIFIAAGILIVFAAWLYLHPGWQSSDSIRESLLKITPLGSGINQVLSVAQRRGWVQRNASVNHASGHGYYDFITSNYDPGTASLWGVLRHDPFPYRTSVLVTWTFNSSNQLADISITRYE